VLIVDGSGKTVQRLRRQIDDRIGLARRCRQRIAPTPLRLPLRPESTIKPST